MTQDDLATHLDNLKRDDCYRVADVLKEGRFEKTQKVYFLGSNGAEQGPYVRKYISQESGLGQAYKSLYDAWQRGKRFKYLPVVFECYSLGTDLVVVMEYIRGETLQEVVYRCDPSPALAYDIFPRACDAAKELHESFDQPLIHRDLKPSNIMLTKDSLTLIDFGIARSYKEDSDQDTHHFGTRAYAPPEQFGFGQTDIRSDVYALGMVLYFCLTEKTPHIKAWKKGFASDGIPNSLQQVILKATDIDPEKRYQSIAELQQDFMQAYSGLRVKQQVPGARQAVSWQVPEPAQKPMREMPEKPKKPPFYTLGVIWDFVVIITFALFCMVGASIIFFPDTSTDLGKEPLYLRFIEVAVAVLLVMGPVFFLVLDKRPLGKKFPILKSTSLLKQFIICAAIFVLGFLVIGIASMIAVQTSS